ncbi:hypothetical protein EJ04DRAFT_567147 [Polyplosphaeria fusca]|uniref:F-box domain-containing protein n=1 Tax=Polyplosphaeria fusca TaxID=682080 RepID=A0A9P4QP96_9PLEO|nr:hypothetical protein EJ04DRAFT_567147 [Polyplosphaeria fusca]
MTTVAPTPPPDHAHDRPPLPRYQSRHTSLPYDPSDITALLASIASSQTPPSTPRLPFLPAELLMHILEHVPADHILPFRLVCRAFCDVVDTAVMYSYLQRIELVGWVGPVLFAPGRVVDVNDLQYRFVRAGFGGLLGRGGEEGRWAVFRMDDRWFDLSKKRAGESDAFFGDPLFERVRRHLQPKEGEGVVREREFGVLRWCVKVGVVVMDVDAYGLQEKVEEYFRVSFRDRTITVDWRELLRRLLKTEHTVRQTMRKNQQSHYTFDLEEDCLRAVRRMRMRSHLDLQQSHDRRCDWALGKLRPLFGRRRYDKASFPWDQLEQNEDDAMSILKELRREARMSFKERMHFESLVRDWQTYVEEHERIAALTSRWVDNVYLPRTAPSSPPPWYTEGVSLNYLTWSDGERKTIEDRIRRWKSQKGTIEQLEDLLESSNVALEVPEDAFDISMSDF